MEHQEKHNLLHGRAWRRASWRGSCFRATYVQQSQWDAGNEKHTGKITECKTLFTLVTFPLEIGNQLFPVHENGGFHVQWFSNCCPSIFCVAEMESPWPQPLSCTAVWLVRSYLSWTIKACNWERNREGKKKKRAGSFVIKVSWIQLNLESRVASTKNAQNTSPLQSSCSLASSIHKHTDLAWHHCLTPLLQYQLICFFKSSKFLLQNKLKD